MDDDDDDDGEEEEEEDDDDDDAKHWWGWRCGIRVNVTTGYRTGGFVHGLRLIRFMFYKNHAT